MRYEDTGVSRESSSWLADVKAGAAGARSDTVDLHAHALVQFDGFTLF